MKVRVPIEVDITYVNKTWFTLKKRSSNEKHYVIGIYQRSISNIPGKAVITALQDNSPETILAAMTESIEKGCLLYAEEGILPDIVKTMYEVQELKDGERSRGDIHVNNVKNMWRDLKRVIKMTNVHVSKKYLQLYCSEVAWRINHAHLSNNEKFDLALQNCSLIKPRKKGSSQDVVE